MDLLPALGSKVCVLSLTQPGARIFPQCLTDPERGAWIGRMHHSHPKTGRADRVQNTDELAWTDYPGDV
jgi:hypothetical protein